MSQIIIGCFKCCTFDASSSDDKVDACPFPKISPTHGDILAQEGHVIEIFHHDISPSLHINALPYREHIGELGYVSLS